MFNLLIFSCKIIGKVYIFIWNYFLLLLEYFMAMYNIYLMLIVYKYKKVQNFYKYTKTPKNNNIQVLNNNYFFLEVYFTF